MDFMLFEGRRKSWKHYKVSCLGVGECGEQSCMVRLPFPELILTVLTMRSGNYPIPTAVVCLKVHALVVCVFAMMVSAERRIG